MIVGVPTEIMPGEGRVAASPETVARMCEAGFTVLVQEGAGKGSGIDDGSFRTAGAQTVSLEAVWSQAEIILKVKQPMFNRQLGVHEAELLPEGRCLITFLHPANSLDVVEILRRRNITSFTMDSIPRTPEARPMDALSSMSLLAGYRAAIMAANLAPRMFGAAEAEVGHLEPIRVLVVGFGVVGLAAVRTCLQLNAEVAILDLREEAQQRALALGVRSVQPAGQHAGDFNAAVMDAISSELPHTDVLILSALVFAEKAPILLTREMLKKMPWGAVVVDVSVDQGGNCEVTAPGEIVTVDDVKVVGILNLPGQVPVDATRLYSRNVANFLFRVVQNGRIVTDDLITRAALVTHAGEITHAGTLKAFQIVS
ncbi:MAG: NAD(P)(+) transhydrogenase (Re/Si-specific) subunit alpha [Armatimonadetes bacterium]|nr:NAD(P)(+) transhydrogenase (Re/Si-specific) subunit alpha [Armatimonadota bacterium]